MTASSTKAQNIPTKACHIYDVGTSIVTAGVDVGQIQIMVKFPKCNLACRNCPGLPEGPIDSCRYEGTPGVRDYYYVSTPIFHVDLANVIRNYRDFKRIHHSVRLCGGEPLLYSDFIGFLCEDLRNRPFPIRLQTNGTLPEELARVIEGLDIVTIDYKLKVVEGNDSYLEALKECVRIGRAAGKVVEVNVGVTQEVLESEVREVAVTIAEIDSEVPFALQPMCSPKDGASISHLRLMRLLDAASYKLDDVHVIPSIQGLLQD